MPESVPEPPQGEPERVPVPGDQRAEPDPASEETPVSDFNQAMQDCLNIEGALGAALVDVQSGMALATAGSPQSVNLEIAAAGNSSVMQAKMRTMQDLGLQDEIEDILITLGRQYHIIRPISGRDGKGLFLYLVLDRARANLAMARFRLTKIEQDFRI